MGVHGGVSSNCFIRFRFPHICSTGIASEFDLPVSWKQNQDTEAQTTASAAALERIVLSLIPEGAENVTHKTFLCLFQWDLN